MINTLLTGKMRKKWMATAVRSLLFALLFAQHGPTATSWATDDANGSAAASLSAAEHESVVDNFFAAYFEQPCCVRPRHVRHHKSESFISYFVLNNTQVQKKVVKTWLGTVNSHCVSKNIQTTRYESTSSLKLRLLFCNRSYS